MSTDKTTLSSRLTFGFLCALTVGMVTGCSNIYRYLTSGEVGWAIKQEIRDRHKTEIVLTRLTRFTWDELIIFSSYTPHDEICQRLMLDERDCAAADLPEPLNDGLSLLVFRLNKKIVHREIHLGYHGEFRVEERSFSPKDAFFHVEPQGTLSNGGRQLFLRWHQPLPSSSPAK